MDVDKLVFSHLSCPVLQTLLLVLHEKDDKLCSKLCKKIMTLVKLNEAEDSTMAETRGKDDDDDDDNESKRRYRVTMQMFCLLHVCSTYFKHCYIVNLVFLFIYIIIIHVL